MHLYLINTNLLVEKTNKPKNMESMKGLKGTGMCNENAGWHILGQLPQNNNLRSLNDWAIHSVLHSINMTWRFTNLHSDLRLSEISLNVWILPWRLMEHSSDEGTPNVGKGSGAPRVSYPANGYREDGLSRGQVLQRKSCHRAKENAWPNPFIITI